MDNRFYRVNFFVLSALFIVVKVESWAPLHRAPALTAGASSIDDDECLVPEPNPNSDPNATSLCGVPFSLVTRAIDALYPPNELEKRNAQSRTDGYWKYVSRGEDPPKEFTYGEFDVEFFGELLDLAWKCYSAGEDDGQISPTPWKDKVFCDIGSGTGRLVIAAAALHPNWSLCRGLEILQAIHDVSIQILDECKLYNEESNSGEAKYGLQVPTNASNETIKCVEPEETIMPLPMAPIQFTCGSFLDEYEYLGNIDCAFCFSSCMKPQLLQELSIAIGRQLKPGSIIITTEFPLVLRGRIPPSKEDESMPHGEYDIELLDKVDGWCWLTGGESTAYIHRVKKSLWNDYAGPRTKPKMTLEDEAYQLVQLMESGQLTDVKAWWRGVHNELRFRGISLKDLSYEDLIIELLKL